MRLSDEHEIWRALEYLRGSEIVSDARSFARTWEQSYHRKMVFRRAVFGWPALVAASLIGGMIAVGVAHWSVRENVFETGNLEMRTEFLPDGSTILLNANSRVVVSFSPNYRDIDLTEGEVHFEVAKDPHRPFRVRAGAAEVIAVGTEFDVSKQSRQTTVTLIQGRVDVRGVHGDQIEGIIDTLHPSQQLAIANDGHVVRKGVAQLDSVTAWERGTMSFDDMTLADAIAKFNRYSAKKIALQDSRFASARISGIFRNGDTKAFVGAIEKYFGLKANWAPDGTVSLDGAGG